MVDILIIIIDRSGGRIRSLKDLALFLKNNVKLYRFVHDRDKTVEEPAATYSSCKSVLQSLLNLSSSEAEEALRLLHNAGFVRISEISWPLEIDGYAMLDKIVKFNV